MAETAFKVKRGDVVTKQAVKRDVNDSGTWAYPNIPSGVTVIRKENVTDDEIYGIYKECIEIQRDACIRMLNRRGNKSPLPP